MTIEARLFGALFLLLLPAAAVAESVPQLAISADGSVYQATSYLRYLPPSGLTDPREADRKAGAFRAPDSHLNPLEFSTAVQWARLSIRNTGAGQRRVVVIIEDYTMNELDVFARRNDGRIHHLYQGGLSARKSLQKIDSPEMAFHLEVNGPEEVTLLFRIGRQYASVFRVNLYEDGAFGERRFRQVATTALYYGIILALIIYNLFLRLSTGERVYGLYALMITVSHALALPGLYGITHKMIWGDLPWFSTRSLVLIGLTALCWFWFVAEFLQSKTRAPVLHRWLAVASWGTFFISGTYFVSPETIVMVHTEVGVVVCLCLTMVMAWRVWQKGFMPGKYALVAWSVYVFFGIVRVMWSNGLLPDYDFFKYGPLTGGALEGLILSLALGHRMKVLTEEKQAAQEQFDQLQNSLTGVVPPLLLRKIADHPDLILTEVFSQRVTILYAGIEGHALTTKKMLPEESFRTTRYCHAAIAATVLARGGIVDKSVGDGLVCYFGFDFSGTAIPGHEADAMACALAIQQESAEVIRQNRNSRVPVYPLRIGIATGLACLGNMAGRDRLDFTVSGPPVTDAVHLQQACEPYRILVCEETGTGAGPGKGIFHLQPRLVPRGHAEKLSTALELTAAGAGPHPGEQIYREFHGFEQQSPRIPAQGNRISFSSEYGRHKLHDFSDAGLGLLSGTWIGRGAVLELYPETADNAATAGLPAIIAVRIVWGQRIADGEYRHGVKIISRSPARLQKIQDALQANQPKAI